MSMIELKWPDFKSVVDQSGAPVRHIETPDWYLILASEFGISFSCKILKNGNEGWKKDFEDNYKQAAPSGELLTVVYEVNSQLSYKCEALNDALSSEAKWRISRTTKSGKVTKTEFANNGAFISICDDRETYFGPVVFDNVYSTYFDGINDTVSFGDNHGFDRNIAFSFSLWVNPQNTSQTRYFINKMTADASAIGWRVGHDTTGKIILQARPWGQGFAPITFNSVLTAQQWTHIMVCFDGSSNQTGWRVYKNGVIDTYVIPSQVYGYSWGSISPLILGAGTESGFHFVGGIDQFAVYNREVSAAEVLAIYQAGAGQRLSELPSSGSAVLSEWDMGDNDVYPTVQDRKGTVHGTMLSMAIGSFQQDVP